MKGQDRLQCISHEFQEFGSVFSICLIGPIPASKLKPRLLRLRDNLRSRLLHRVLREVVVIGFLVDEDFLVQGVIANVVEQAGGEAVISCGDEMVEQVGAAFAAKAALGPVG